MTNGANSLTAFGLVVGLYGYLGKTQFFEFFGLSLAMLLVMAILLGMLAAGREIAAGARRAVTRPAAYSTIPAWYLTD